MKNRRRFSRVSFVHEMLLVKGKRKYYVHVKNFSLTGAYVVSPLKRCSLAEGETVRYSVVFAGVRPKVTLKGVAKIVWCSKTHSMGLYFVSMNAEGLEFLQMLLAYNLGSEAMIEKEIKRIWQKKND